MASSLALAVASLAACVSGGCAERQGEPAPAPPASPQPLANAAVAPDVPIAPTIDGAAASIDAASRIAATLPDIDPPPIIDANDPMSPYWSMPPAMMTPDGATVLLRLEDPADASGSGLAYELRDRRDRTTRRFVIRKLEDEIIEEVETRRMAVVRKLAKAGGFVPLTELFSGDRGTQTFENGDLRAALANGRLTFEQGNRVLVERKLPRSWQHAAYVHRGEGIKCENPALLSAAFVAPAARLAVVEIAYEGTDTCWAPASQLHVVVW